jgi:hypothetical protein
MTLEVDVYRFLMLLTCGGVFFCIGVAFALIGSQALRRVIFEWYYHLQDKAAVGRKMPADE